MIINGINGSFGLNGIMNLFLDAGVLLNINVKHIIKD